jgi:hypothetical protein
MSSCLISLCLARWGVNGTAHTLGYISEASLLISSDIAKSFWRAIMLWKNSEVPILDPSATNASGCLSRFDWGLRVKSVRYRREPDYRQPRYIIPHTCFVAFSLSPILVFLWFSVLPSSCMPWSYSFLWINTMYFQSKLPCPFVNRDPFLTKGLLW